MAQLGFLLDLAVSMPPSQSQGALALCEVMPGEGRLFLASVAAASAPRR
jgi:hypothetical protein